MPDEPLKPEPKDEPKPKPDKPSKTSSDLVNENAQLARELEGLRSAVTAIEKTIATFKPKESAPENKPAPGGYSLKKFAVELGILRPEQEAKSN